MCSGVPCRCRKAAATGRNSHLHLLPVTRPDSEGKCWSSRGWTGTDCGDRHPGLLGKRGSWCVQTPPSIFHSSPSLGSEQRVQWMPAFGPAHALGGSTSERSNVPRSCNKGVVQHGSMDVGAHCQQGGCSLTFPHPAPPHSQTQLWPFAHAGDSFPLTREHVQLSMFTERSHQNLGFCQLMELNWLHTGTSSNVTEVAGVHDLQWVQPFWKHWTIRMTQHLTGLSHKYWAQQKHLRSCSMHSAFNTTS